MVAVVVVAVAVAAEMALTMYLDHWRWMRPSIVMPMVGQASVTVSSASSRRSEPFAMTMSSHSMAERCSPVASEPWTWAVTVAAEKSYWSSWSTLPSFH